MYISMSHAHINRPSTHIDESADHIEESASITRAMATERVPGQPHGAIQNALATVAEAAEARAAEGKTLFMTIAGQLDDHARSEELKKLPKHKRRAMEEFCLDLQRVATRHFEAYIRGDRRPPPPYHATASTTVITPPETPLTTRPSSPQATDKPTDGHRQTYAQASSRTNHTTKTAPEAKSPPRTAARTKTAGTDDRLFVRLPDTPRKSCRRICPTCEDESGDEPRREIP